jgi:hypothetical protein
MNRESWIPVGATFGASYNLVFEARGYAVYAKRFNGQVTYVIAKAPENPFLRSPPPPASVCEEFTDRLTAQSALQHWATEPLPPRPVGKRRKDKAADQLHLNL